MNHAASTGPAAAAHRDDSIARGTIFAAAFALLLCVALVAQLLTLQWRSWLPGAESERSLIGGVKAAVDTLMPYLP